MLNQQVEANSFKQANQGNIEKAREAIMAACRRFLQGPALAVLSNDEVRRAYHAIGEGNLQAFFQQIRPQAHRFANTNHSVCYWGLVDAMGFLQDATGTHWPYMTGERRLQLLTWASAEVEQVH